MISRLARVLPILAAVLSLLLSRHASTQSGQYLENSPSSRPALATQLQINLFQDGECHRYRGLPQPRLQGQGWRGDFHQWAGPLQLADRCWLITPFVSRLEAVLIEKPAVALGGETLPFTGGQVLAHSARGHQLDIDSALPVFLARPTSSIALRPLQDDALAVSNELPNALHLAGLCLPWGESASTGHLHLRTAQGQCVVEQVIPRSQFQFPLAVRQTLFGSWRTQDGRGRWRQKPLMLQPGRG